MKTFVGVTASNLTIMLPKWKLLSGFKVHFLHRRPLPEWALIGMLILYVLMCMFIYFLYVQPWINGNIDVRIGADSDRYWDAIRLQEQGSSQNAIISLSSNLLGPLMEGLLLRNGFLVMCFNILLFSIAMKLAGSIPYLNKAKFGFLVLMCPELLPTLATLNKEIFALLGAVVTAKYLYSRERSKLLLLFAFTVSVFARWEQAAILVLTILLSAGPFRDRPKLAIAALILGITVAYPLTFSILGIDMTMFDWILEGANTVVKLDLIQMHYGFPIVVIPKIIMMAGGRLLQPAFFFSDELMRDIQQDPQQSLFQPLGSIAYFVVFGITVATRRASVARPIAFISIVTLVASAATPFVQPRYLYAIYIMLCLDLARPASAGVLHSEVGTSCKPVEHAGV